MNRRDLSILIVTRNARRWIGPLLAHLQHETTGMKAEVIVVDNASRDGTAAYIEREFPWAHLMASSRDLGLSEAMNLAARLAMGRYLLLLSPGTTPLPGCLKLAVQRLNANPQVGIAGGRRIDTEGADRVEARMFPTLKDEFFTLSGLAARFPRNRLLARLSLTWADPHSSAQVDWIPGTFVFVPAQVFDKLGGFDERFAQFYEDVDFSRRVQALGLEVQYWPELSFMQHDSASPDAASGAADWQQTRMRAALLYYRKHHGEIAATSLFALEWCWYRLRQIKATLQQHPALARQWAAHCQLLVHAWRDARFPDPLPAGHTKKS